MESAKAFLLLVLVSCFASRSAAVATITNPAPRTVFLNENSPPGTPVVSIRASDPDGGAFTFVLQNQQPAVAVPYFTISNTGDVTVNTAPDREAAPGGVTFDVVLMQSSVTRGRVPVTVVLRDVNDNSPVWVNDPGIAQSVDEHLLPGVQIYQLRASDADSGLNRIVVFNLDGPIGGPFSVDRTSGIVTLSGTLDYETTPMYTIRITAQDRGSPPMSTPITLRVNVVDTLEGAPIFTQEVYSVSIAERNYTSPQVLGTGVVRASDSAAGIVRYRYLPGDVITNGLFSVDAGTGTATVQGSVDREISDTFSFDVEAFVVNPTNSSVIRSSIAVAVVIVTVTDRNDNGPVFLSSEYTASVSEAAQTGHIVLTSVEATDVDLGTNAVFVYELADTATGVPFRINPTSGLISVSGPLDYETTTSYNFTIVARESLTSEMRRGSAHVVITITDENDNPPVFADTSYSLQITERSLSGTTLGTITADDRDEGEFGTVTYELSGSSVFTVDQNTGVISLRSAVDREQQDTYHLTLIASDGGGTLANPNRAVTLVVVTVQDINDNPPVFSVSGYQFSLVEGTTNTNFLTVTATDDDEPNTPNSTISYSIAWTNGSAVSTYFTIDSGTGAISAHNLDYEVVNIFTLRITARDMGPIPMEGYTHLNVTVQDTNGLAPVFSEMSYTATISEDHTVDTAIGITISATDPEGHNVQYSIISSSATDSALFRVDETSGVLSLAHALNYDDPDRQRTLAFTVRAVDDVTPPRTGLAQVTVQVNNVNDNPPIISNPADSSVAFSRQEDTVPSILFTVTATDADGDQLVYTLTPPTTFFTVDSMGVVSQAMTLDREGTPMHSFSVRVCDTGDTHCVSRSVSVTVTDYNDHPPVFVMTSYSATISECDQVRSDLATVVARDTTDVGVNAEVYYEVVGGDTNRLSLNNISGVITLTPQRVDYETGPPTYSLTIRARDNPSSTGPKLTTANNATFTLTVTDCNDFPPVFTQTDHSFTISERSMMTTANEIVYTNISVTDQDTTAANTMVRYQIVGGLSSTNNWFNINPTTGSIFIPSGETIDREDPFLQIDSMGRGVLSFRIEAVNQAVTGSFTATATVTVRVTDINDNSPVIQQTGPIVRDVVEHTRNRTQLAVISATDADYGDNAHIAYNIMSGNSANKFAIDSERGIVYLNGDLDAEGSDVSFTLTVSAENDRAAGASPDTITIQIRVIGTNDHAPEFSHRRYNATIMEENALTGMSAVIDSTIAMVVATDRDDPTAQLHYSITAGNELGIFDIPNPASGTVTVVRPDLIDYETNTQFDLVITASDLVVPENERRTNTTHMVITVTDVNDNIPMFLDREYYGTVREELPPGSTVAVIPTIRAIDADEDGNDPLIIEFVDGTPNLAFRITTDGSTVTTSRRLDRETEPTFNITVRVRDLANHEMETYLIIDLTDFNDNAPQFLETPAELAIRVPENIEVGEIVQKVNVTDADIDSNAVVTFSMMGARGYFGIDIHTGVISIIQSLDRELIQSYNLTIIATNAVNPTLDNSTTFTVTVEDRNDNDPVFTMSSFVGNVTEEVPINTRLNLFVHAEDQDPGSMVQYTLVPGTTTLFDVDPNTGQIYTTGRIDREASNFHFFMVEANDTLIGSMKPTALVEVMVLDINDQSPIFEEEAYENDVYELTPANVILFIISANDDDIGTNAEIEYSIASVSPPSSAGLFAINNNSGSIFPTREVSLMVGDPLTINLTIRATDRGPGHNSETVIVTLNLVDRNTGGPQFEQPHYNFSVFENANVLFGTVTANEMSPDLGENARILYRISPREGSESEKFHINAMGNLSVIIPLDRETRDLYTLTLVATDNATIPRSGFATVTVFVLDENDNTPYFDPSSYPISISESTEVGATVIRILAFDDDIGSNAQLSLNISSGNTSVFQVDNDGILTTIAELDREQQFLYRITITAEDMGVPVRSQNANVIITINDVNDNSPVFVEGVTEISQVYEDARPGYQLTTVRATDPDYQLNGYLAYSFENGSLLKGPFQIDPEHGHVTLQGTLDRENEDSYSLMVTAADQRGRGLNVRRTTAALRVRVLDVNDNIPFFTQVLYEFFVPEDTSREITIGQVEGSDRDIGPNAVLYYHLLGSSTTSTVCDGMFCIDPMTGRIYLSGELDRETQDLYILQAAVSNNLNLTFNGTSPEDATTAPVTVMVQDVNDNPPQFVSSTLTAAVAEEADFGTTITTLMAMDRDIGSGQVVWFEFTTTQVPFIVDRDSGVVTTADVFQGQTGTRYTIPVRAYDNKGVQPSLSTTNSLIVQVFKTSEQVIVTFGCEKEDVEANINQIYSALTNIIQGRVDITQVRVKRTDEGTVDVSSCGENLETAPEFSPQLQDKIWEWPGNEARSDIVFFVLHPTTGDVVQPDTVLQLIDQSGVGTLNQAAGSTCSVEGIRPYPPPPGTTEVWPVFMWPVIAVLSAIIVFVCCCFLCGVIVERRRTRRLRKRSRLDQYSQFSASQMSEYNAVNNPLWIAPYETWDEPSSTEPSGTQVERDNPLYESQELTIEMFQDDDDEPPSGSQQRLVPPPPLTTSTPAGGRESTYSGADDDELLAEALGEPQKGPQDYNSETSLI